MIRSNKIRYIGLSSLLLTLFISAQNYTPATITDKKFESIEKLINENQLSAEIKGTGGHQAECISISLKNLTNDTLNVWLEAGRRLVSVDSALQDLFIVKNRKIELPPLQEQTISGYGFCCQSHNGGPRKDSEFELGFMAPPDWQELAKVIDEHEFPVSAIQSAVWVLSDDHSLSSVHSEDLEEIQLLRQTLADIKGVKLPWYTLTYVDDTSTLFTNKPEKMISDVSYFLNTNAAVSIQIRNSKGEIVYTVAHRINPGRGTHSFHLRLPVKNWPQGEYSLCIYEDYNNLNTKKTFLL